MASGNFQRKSLDSPDETRTFENGKVGVVTFGDDFTASRLVLEPGWRWSENVKPIAGTDSCQVLHTDYHVSGRLHVRLDDGTEEEFGPGDAYVILRDTTPGWWATNRLSRWTCPASRRSATPRSNKADDKARGRGPTGSRPFSCPPNDAKPRNHLLTFRPLHGQPMEGVARY
jgi:hypothetical protein